MEASLQVVPKLKQTPVRIERTNLIHKLLQHVLLLLLIASGLSHLLLPLVIHHFLNHASSLSIKVTQSAVFRLNLGNINLRRRCYDVGPPFHFIHFVEVYFNNLCSGGRSCESPGGLVDSDLVGKVTL
jgi:hypothetical protein